MPTAGYYDRYAEIIKVEDLRAEVGSVDGVPAIAVFRMPSSAVPAYFILLSRRRTRLPHSRLPLHFVHRRGGNSDLRAFGR